MLATTPTGRAMCFARLRDRATQRCGSYRTSRVLQLLLALLLTSLAGILVAQPAPSMASVGGATPTGHIYDVQGAPPVSSDATTERGSPTACSPHRIHEAGEPRPYGPSARSWRAEDTAAYTHDDPAPLVRAARPAATSGTLVRSASTGHVAFSGAGVAAKSADDVTNVLIAGPRHLQSKFKHAADFGVKGSYSKANAADFNAAIQQHLNAAGTQTIRGTYRGDAVTHFVDPQTGLNVISRDGVFVSGWRLNADQLSNVLRNGSLGGG